MSSQGWPTMGGPATVLPPIGGGQPAYNGNGQGVPGMVAPGVMVPGAVQQAQPTGQFMVPPGNQTAYGIANLPPAPPPPGQPQFQGQVPLGPQGQYGLPGAYGQPPMVPAQYMQQLPAQPPVQQPQGWPQGPQGPQGGPQQPGTAPVPSQGQPQQLSPQTRLDGPNVPPELRGRTIGEVMALYNSMATMAQGYGRPQAGAPMVPAQPGAGPQVGGQQQPAAAPPGSFWQNPDQRFEQILERVIDQRMGPVVQFTQTQALTGARMAAQQQVPDFAQLEVEVQQLVANAQPEALANPNTWIGAADIVRGRQMREGRYQPQARQPQLPGQQPSPSMQPGGLPGMPNSTQLPPGAFFTEAPAAPAPVGMGGTPAQPTAQDVAAAAKFNMPIAEYMGWKYGVQPVTTPNPGSTFPGQQPVAPWHYGPYTGGGR